MPSIQSKAINVLLHITRMKRTVNRMRQRVESGERTYTEPSPRMHREHQISKREINGHLVWTIAPLKNAVAAIVAGEVDAVMFTTGVQVVHLWQVVRELQVEPEVRRGLARAVISSIGPTTSEELRRHGLAVDLEASHPRFGLLIRELAEQAPSLLRAKGHEPPPNA